MAWFDFHPSLVLVTFVDLLKLENIYVLFGGLHFYPSNRKVNVAIVDM